MSVRRAIVWAGVWILTVLVLIAQGQSEHRLETARVALLDSLQRSRVVTDSLRAALAVQRPVADRWRTRWDTLTLRGDTLRVRDTLYVPYAVVIVADSTIAACHRALDTCAILADSLTRERDGWQRMSVLERQRPRTALGVTYDGRVGATLDRDAGRLRVGASLTPRQGSVRVLWWW